MNFITKWKDNIIKQIHVAEFCFDGVYGFLALLTNPFFLIRRNLYNNIRDMAENMQGKLLDFGCGSKPYKKLFQHCDEYIGCDIEISGHSHINENIDVFYDGCNLPFHDGEFDCVFASEVFEHIFNLENILGELNRVLKPQGSMLITVPFVWNEHEIPYDFARYTSFGIVDLLHRTGFEIIELRKSTLYVETVATMVTEYVRLEITKRVRYGLIVRFLQIMFTVPILFLGLILGWVMPENDTWYCNNIIWCKKQE